MTPKYFFEENNGGRSSVRSRLNSHCSIVLFLDYDGTLVPIQSKPELARLSSETAGLIESILRNPKFFVCIVTGRSLENIRNLVSIKGISFIGNHGFEICHKGKYWIHPGARKSRLPLRRVFVELKRATEHIDGILIENKNLSISIHYRNVPKIDQSRIKEVISTIASLDNTLFKITAGKKVYEIRPNIDWDKGKAVMKWTQISGMDKSLKIYIGDDRTDEDAFRAIGDDGITISVGYRKKTFAQYYVKNHQEVLSFLNDIIRASM